MAGPSAAAILLDTLAEGTEVDLAGLSGLAWADIVAVAAAYDVMPLLWRRVRERGADAVLPPRERGALVDADKHANVRAAARREQLAELLVAFNRAGVQAVVLKGAFLSEHGYADPWLRPTHDLDLLVRDAQMEDARSVAADLGYASVATSTHDRDYSIHRHSAPMFRPGRLRLEIHRSIEPCAPPFMLDLDSVWERAMPARVAGADALALAPDDLLMHLATHMGHSHWLGTSFVRVYDLLVWSRRFAGAVDWAAVAARAAAAGTARFVYAGLALAHRTLGAVPPSAALAHGAADERAVAAAASLLASPPAVVPGQHGLTLPDRLPVTRVPRFAAAFPRQPRLRAIYGASHSAWGLYARYFTRAFARACTLAYLAARPSTRRLTRERLANTRMVRAWSTGGA